MLFRKKNKLESRLDFIEQRLNVIEGKPKKVNKERECEIIEGDLIASIKYFCHPFGGGWWKYEIDKNGYTLVSGNKGDYSSAKEEAKEHLSKLEGKDLIDLKVKFQGAEQKYLTDTIKEKSGCVCIHDYRRDKELVINLSRAEIVEVTDI